MVLERIARGAHVFVMQTAGGRSFISGGASVVIG